MNFYDKQNNEIIRFLMEQNTILQEQIRILTESSKQKDDIISELTTIISSQSVQKTAEENTFENIQTDTQMTVKHLADEWYTNYAEKNHRETTRNSERLIANRINHDLGENSLQTISTITIQSYVNKLSEKGGNLRTGNPLSRKTIKNYMTYLTNIFSYGVKYGYIKDNPCSDVDIPKINGNGETMRPKEIKIYTIDEAKTLLSTLKHVQFKYQIFFTLAMLTGLRRGEILGLEWNDFDFDKCNVRIKWTSNYTPKEGIYTDVTKTEKSQRFIKIPKELSKLLKLYQNSQQFDFRNRKGKGLEIVKTDRLFTQANGKPMHPNTPYKWLERMCKKNGLPFYGIHTFRHLNASLQINAGIDAVTVSATLGHSTPTTTLNIYSHCFEENKTKSVDIVNTALGGFI